MAEKYSLPELQYDYDALEPHIWNWEDIAARYAAATRLDLALPDDAASGKAKMAGAIAGRS